MAGTASPAAGYGSTACTARRARRRPSLPTPHSPSPTSFSAAQPCALPRSRSLTPRPAARSPSKPNSVLYPVCFLVVTAIGAVATTANPLYTRREIAKQVADAGVKLVVTISELLPKIADLRLPAILLDDGDGASVPSDYPNNITLYSDLVAGVRETEYLRLPTRQSDTAALFYSSGTTGASKGVVLTHGNFIAAVMAATTDQDELGEGRNVFLCFLPMFHIYGMSVVTLGQLRRGNAVVVMARFDLEAVLAAVERHRVTYLYVVPPVMIALAKHGRSGRYDLSSLRCIASVAAPLGKDVMEAVADKFPNAEIIQVSEHFRDPGVPSEDRDVLPLA